MKEDAAPPDLDLLPCAVLVTDGEGRVCFSNAELRARIGDAWLAAPGRRVEDLLQPAARIFLQTHVWPLLLRQGRADEIYLTLCAADGRQVPVLLNARCERGESPLSVLRVHWVFFVATERQRFEAELLRTRQRLQNLLLSSDAGTWEWQVHTGALKINMRWAELLGWSPSQIAHLDHDFRMAQVHPDDAARTQALLQSLLRGEQAEYVNELRLRHCDGHWLWALERGRVISSNADGSPEWVFGTLTDISKAMAQRTSLRRSEELLQRTNALAGVGGWELDLRTQSLYWSEQTCRIHGVALDHQPALEEALGYYPPDARSQIEAALQRCLTESDDWDLELPFVRLDGTPLVVRAMGSVECEAGVPVRLIGALQDVTAQHQVNLALRRAITAAEAASAAKGLFLANMSHEIRTPMNAVIGIAHLLADSPLNDDQRQLLSKLQIAGRSLLGVINDVLDLAKIEAGELATELISYRPAVVLRELDALFADQARAKGLAWSVATAADLPEAVLGDPQRLKQVLSNLLSNAIKFTPAGQVSLRLEPGAAAPPQGEASLRFRVRDSGIGIAPEAQAQLFQPFMQAEASTSRRFGGTGLGLSIVKHLVELMGGTVALSSQPGRGSEFIVELPLRAAAPGLSAGVAYLEAVIVEDEPDPRERLAALCAGFGWRSPVFEVAEGLLDLVRERQSQHQRLPDVLLIDWHLGDGLDGLSALRRLRDWLPPAAMPAALLITQDQAGALQAQDVAQLVDAVLAKPATPSTLFNAVNEAIARRSGSSEHLLDQTAVQRLGGGLLPGVRLLVVDDSEINLEVARRMLERQGAEVVCTDQAATALARLAGGEPFDAVLMDIQMPVMDGLEATRQIRRLPGLTALPVLALTAGALVEERRRALEAGMDDFLTKPLDPEALVRTLRRHIEARRGAPLPVRAAEPDPRLPDDWPQIDGIAAAETAHRLAGDTGLFRRLLARLLESYGAAWVGGLEALDAAQAAAALHKLRGSASLLGAQRLQELAAAGEAQLRAGATPATLAPLLAELAQALAAQRAAAAAWLAQAPLEDARPDPEPLLDARQAFADLLSMLRNQDLEAGNLLAALRPWLREQGASAEDIAQLVHCVDELDYVEALRLLVAHGARAAEIRRPRPTA